MCPAVGCDLVPIGSKELARRSKALCQWEAGKWLRASLLRRNRDQTKARLLSSFIPLQLSVGAAASFPKNYFHVAAVDSILLKQRLPYRPGERETQLR
jgi:hypothetical protein